MSLRIRTDGRVVCAAFGGEEPGDVYLDDAAHQRLATDMSVLATDDGGDTWRFRAAPAPASVVGQEDREWANGYAETATDMLRDETRGDRGLFEFRAPEVMSLAILAGIARGAGRQQVTTAGADAAGEVAILNIVQDLLVQHSQGKCSPNTQRVMAAAAHKIRIVIESLRRYAVAPPPTPAPWDKDINGDPAIRLLVEVARTMDTDGIGLRNTTLRASIRAYLASITSGAVAPPPAATPTLRPEVITPVRGKPHLHCRSYRGVCRGDDYCSCQCDRCYEAHYGEPRPPAPAAPPDKETAK